MVLGRMLRNGSTLLWQYQRSPVRHGKLVVQAKFLLFVSK